MNARLLERHDERLLRPVEIDIAGVNCIGLTTKANEDGTVQVHAFHPSGVVVHDKVTLTDDEDEAPAPLAESSEVISPSGASSEPTSGDDASQEVQTPVLADGDVPGGVPKGEGDGEQTDEQVPSIAPGDESNQGAAAEGEAGVPETQQ